MAPPKVKKPGPKTYSRSATNRLRFVPFTPSALELVLDVVRSTCEKAESSDMNADVSVALMEKKRKAEKTLVSTIRSRLQTTTKPTDNLRLPKKAYKPSPPLEAFGQHKAFSGKKCIKYTDLERENLRLTASLERILAEAVTMEAALKELKSTTAAATGEEGGVEGEGTGKEGNAAQGPAISGANWLSKVACEESKVVNSKGGDVASASLLPHELTVKLSTEIVAACKGGKDSKKGRPTQYTDDMDEYDDEGDEYEGESALWVPEQGIGKVIAQLRKK